jgi:malonyl-CoA/methylmalonyl-CoA synthetase
VLVDSGASAAVVHASYPAFGPLARERGLRVVDPGEGPAVGPDLPGVSRDRRALILYTSGTTSSPKGAVLTHANIEAEITCLIDAWGWSPDDRILHVLPLNHTHGLINVLACALWAGACCDMLPRADVERVWDRFGRGDLSLFMAVPTIYRRLVAAWDGADQPRRQVWSEGARRLRLMVSGSAALPVGLLERWRQITGHVLLERYGMTEIGMAISNPLAGERRPGCVGVPLPRVEVRLCDEAGAEVPPGQPGEIHVKGPGVFLEYWGRRDATAEAFEAGWFRTGDISVLERGMYRILGRSSVDIIKTGGYKVSALEIEDVLREHSDVSDCAVVGIDDPEWGERVSAAVVSRSGAPVEVDDLRAWARGRMAAYKLPASVVTVEELPRNAMGKVSKHDVKRLFDRLTP